LFILLLPKPQNPEQKLIINQMSAQYLERAGSSKDFKTAILIAASAIINAIHQIALGKAV